MSYDMIDRFLRNNLHDEDYAEFSAALDAVIADAAAAHAQGLRERIAELEHTVANLEGVLSGVAKIDAGIAELEAQRVPLTHGQMLACVRSVGLPAPMGLTRDVGPYEVTQPTYFLELLIRAVERAHGIEEVKR